MLRMRRSAVVPKRNLLGKFAKDRLPLDYVLGLGREELLDMLDRGYRLPQLAGGTTAVNNVMANPVYFPRAIAVTTDQAIKQGDLVWWDSVNYTLKPVTVNTQVAVGAGTGGFCGCAQGTSQPGVYPTPPAGTPSENLPGVVVQRGGSVKLASTTGDGHYNPFDPVTVGADAQTVTSNGQSSSNRVGFVLVPLPVAARTGPAATPVPETAAGGASVEVWLESKFPDTALL